MSNRWFYEIDGQVVGPVEQTRLRLLADSGMLQPHHKVRREDQPTWSQASAVRGLLTPMGRRLRPWRQFGRATGGTSASRGRRFAVRRVVAPRVGRLCTGGRIRLFRGGRIGPAAKTGAKGRKAVQARASAQSTGTTQTGRCHAAAREGRKAGGCTATARADPSGAHRRRIGNPRSRCRGRGGRGQPVRVRAAADVGRQRRVPDRRNQTLGPGEARACSRGPGHRGTPTGTAARAGPKRRGAIAAGARARGAGSDGAGGRGCSRTTGFGRWTGRRVSASTGRGCSRLPSSPTARRGTPTCACNGSTRGSSNSGTTSPGATRTRTPFLSFHAGEQTVRLIFEGSDKPYRAFIEKVLLHGVPSKPLGPQKG